MLLNKSRLDRYSYVYHNFESQQLVSLRKQ